MIIHSGCRFFRLTGLGRYGNFNIEMSMAKHTLRIAVGTSLQVSIFGPLCLVKKLDEAPTANLSKNAHSP